MMRTVLVVDDDPAFRELATRLLRDWGHQVVGEAGSLAEALERADESRPDVALVDVALPDGNGFDLTRSLVARRPVRIVLISSNPDPAFTAAAHRAGAAGFFSKDQLTDAALRRLIAE